MPKPKLKPTDGKRMKTSSCKAKGRRLQQLLRDTLLKWAPDLKPDDIRSCSMGAQGEDIQLSPLARTVYPMSFECKNTEKINIWKAFEQAQENCGEWIPVVCFGRNRSEPMVAMKLDDFLRLVR